MNLKMQSAMAAISSRPQLSMFFSVWPARCSLTFDRPPPEATAQLYVPIMLLG